jgi:hypothetical protein
MKLNTLNLSSSNVKPISQCDIDQVISTQIMKTSFSDTQCLKFQTNNLKDSVKIKSILINNSSQYRSLEKHRTCQPWCKESVVSKRYKLKNNRGGVKKQLKFEQDYVNRIDAERKKFEIIKKKMSLSLQNIRQISKVKNKDSKSETDLSLHFQIKRPISPLVVLTVKKDDKIPKSTDENSIIFSIEPNDGFP